ncbi:adaptin protein [Natrinema altunense]|uniref:adaptin protein n=1 Tax=Natrinema altunense TaxID=222984 RepID=UPI001872E257|nr:adaptin protein [Natrinema altunense]
MTWTWTPVRNAVDTTNRVVLCFDRDDTLSVNPHPDHRAVPIGWVQYWAHKTDIPVFASGNQHLRTEAEIPGISEAERVWQELDSERYEYENSEFENFIKPRRRDGLRLIQDLYETAFPDEDFRFVVVDDVDVSDLSDEGPWTHYFPWDFVEAVESGDFALEEPPSDAYRNDGVPFNSTDDPGFDHNQNAPLEEIRVQVQEGQPEIEEELQTPNSPGE